MYACDPRWVEAGGSDIQDHPYLLTELWANLGYIKPRLKKENGQGNSDKLCWKQELADIRSFREPPEWNGVVVLCEWTNRPAGRE